MSESKVSVPLFRRPVWIARRKKLLNERKMSAGSPSKCYQQRARKAKLEEAGKHE